MKNKFITVSKFVASSILALQFIPLSASADALDERTLRILTRQVSQLNQAISDVKTILPIFASQLEAELSLTPPDELFVSFPNPCPTGYATAGGVFPGITRCVRMDPPSPVPEPPKVCQAGYTLNEALPDGSPVPSYLVLCEQIMESVATVYLTHRHVGSEGTSLTVQCPVGYVVTGGGYSADANDGTLLSKDILVYSSKPIPPNRWALSGKVISATFQPLSAYAMCILGPGF
jgi:hypothetical protein